MHVNVDKALYPLIGEPNPIAPVPAASTAGWRFVRLSDTPIQVVAIYLFVTLALPAFLLSITDSWPDYYRFEEFSVANGSAVFGAIIVACALRHIQWARTGEMAVRPRTVFVYSMQQLRVLGLLAAIVVAIINFGNSGFRYDDIGLSDRGSISLYVFSIIPACLKLLLIFHAFVYRGTSAMDRLERALITAAFAASINGTGTAFVTVFSFIVLQTPALAYLDKRTFSGASPLRIVFLLGVGALLTGVAALILSGAYVYGESVKQEVPLDMVLAGFDSTWTPNYLIERMAPQYASLVNTLPLTFDFDRDGLSNLIGVWNTFLFRLEALHLFDFGVDRSSTVPITRLNLDFISSIALTDREGTAPGLIPGFIYCFPPIVNVLMLGAYVFMVLGILQRLCLCMKEELSLAGKFILTFFTLPLFETPIDLLLIIDDGFIFFVGLWWMSRLVEVRPAFSTAWQADPAIKSVP